MTAHPERLPTVAVLDNQQVVRDGVLAAIARHPEELVGGAAYASLDEVDLAAPGPDVLVLDLYLGRDDESVLEHIPALTGWAGVVVLHTAEEKPVPLRRAVALGVHGVVLKNDGTESLVDVVRRALEGDFVCSSVVAEALVSDERTTPRLTAREVEVLSNLRDGLTQRQVGSRLHVAEETVRAHLKSVRAKYMEAEREVTNTGSLVREAGRDGWI
ncbi:DNA-binding response regulator, NarL/FixJ family, contains REC and HTH domains [Nocardioides exalbidus]|uniref:DNA-binding response regulator, NarL/FixJ family, contains REC and HTH domains n=1 Tax=Nocardioides exalbidus TaxID=402596 RepID=A0A1H4P4P6_9ACTN|nr:response regulator transcription factor [Nocardioides exalbidus]SEC02447.1 DNA-binding response regulator, NarL/FixJ family, contains REC and HTH domains [Nocardioides exalbidus]